VIADPPLAGADQEAVACPGMAATDGADGVDGTLGTVASTVADHGEYPSEFIALTRAYHLPGARPVMSLLNESVEVAVAGEVNPLLLSYSTKYPVIEAPPLLEGAVYATVIFPAAAVAEGVRGAVGTLGTVTDFVADQTLVEPAAAVTAFLAAARKYQVPGARLLTMLVPSVTLTEAGLVKDELLSYCRVYPVIPVPPSSEGAVKTVLTS